MNLDDAIKHCEEKAKELREEAEHERQNQLNKVKMFNGHFPADYTKATDCLECAKEHGQLAEWLKELKAYREAKEEIGRLPLSWEYGQAVADVWNIIQRHLGKRGQDNEDL